jgi:hypothetical protein
MGELSMSELSMSELSKSVLTVDRGGRRRIFLEG